jgi:hypothetical protein
MLLFTGIIIQYTHATRHIGYQCKPVLQQQVGSTGASLTMGAIHNNLLFPVPAKFR